jgi:hypothetical protein
VLGRHRIRRVEEEGRAVVQIHAVHVAARPVGAGLGGAQDLRERSGRPTRVTRSDSDVIDLDHVDLGARGASNGMLREHGPNDAPFCFANVAAFDGVGLSPVPTRRAALPSIDSTRTARRAK